MKNTKYKILQVVPAMQEGGVERGTLEMALYIKKQGWESQVASHGGRWVKPIQEAGCQHLKLPLHRRDPISILYNGLRLAAYIKAEKPDIIHTRSRAPAWACRLACKLTGTTLLTSFHGTHKIQNKAKWLYNSVMVSGIRTIANSEFIKDHITNNYGLPADKIDMAPRGFDEELFDRTKYSDADICQFFEENDIPQSAPTILMPGRLTRWKGQDVFLKALSYIKEENWTAVIAGGAGKKKQAYMDELKDLAKELGIAGKCHFIGSRDDMPLVYAACDIMVTASSEPEAFGRTAVEAQAMAKPVIATAHGGSLETVKDEETGFLIPPKDSESMAKKLRLLLQDATLRQQMGDKAYAWVHNNFTTEKMCKAEFDVYNRILEIDKD